MNRRRALSLLTVITLGLAAPACDPPVPAASDPSGKDLVEGAVVAAVTDGEKTAGIRTYKVLHVDDYPAPVGFNLHLAAYDPKAPTYQESMRIYRSGGLKVMMAHFEVRLADFIVRDHRVLSVDPLTEDEKAVYAKARDGRHDKFP